MSMPNAPGNIQIAPSDNPSASNSPGLLLLERFTAAMLVAVQVALAWLVLMAVGPETWTLRLPSLEAEVILILLLLAVALVLVSVVALWHTHS